MNRLEAYMQKMIQATLEKNVLNRQPQLLPGLEVNFLVD